MEGSPLPPLGGEAVFLMWRLRHPHLHWPSRPPGSLASGRKPLAGECHQPLHQDVLQWMGSTLVGMLLLLDGADYFLGGRIIEDLFYCS